MAKFSNSSTKKLETCTTNIQRVFGFVIKRFDCKVLFGLRASGEQFKLFKKGREEKNGKWVIVNKNEKVTNCDGYTKVSRHQANSEDESEAIDVIPYPIEWGNVSRMKFFAGYVIGTARAMGIEIRWGGDWDRDTILKDQTFNDYCHFEEVK